MDSPADRHIVQVSNADGTQIITTILAIDDYRLQPTGAPGRFVVRAREVARVIPGQSSGVGREQQGMASRVPK
jgi:hypothetical protein